MRGKPDLVAALEVDPAVVVDREREHQGRDYLAADQGAEDRARPFEEAIDRAADAVRGAETY